MVASGDHIQLKAFQTLANVSGDVLNVFWFEVSSITSPQPLVSIAPYLKTWFQGDFIPPITAMQTAGVQYTRIEVSSVENFETDFAIIDLDSTCKGQVVGEFSSSAAAWSFQLNRTTRVTRNGSKRFAGVPEEQVQNNLPSSTALLYAEEVQVVLYDVPPIPLGMAGEMSLLHVIPKTPTPPATLPSTFNRVSGVSFRGVGSQNTRKQLLS